MRLDQLLVKKGLVNSRTQAQKLIASGKVSLTVSNVETVLKKPSMNIEESAPINIDASSESQYVSRAGDKLKGAVEFLKCRDLLSINFSNKIALDVGQSTGGFTDCLLQEGVRKVVGVDVGHSQIVEKLKNDERVQCLEKTNARELSPQFLKEHTGHSSFDLVVMDVSFISQTLILPVLLPLIKDDGVLLSLVKPQFEVGPKGLSKGGIVKDESLFKDVERKIKKLTQELGLETLQYFSSSITGGDGNKEFFLYSSKKRTR